ncbi:MAG: hypothetical protein K6A65_08510 [Succinivibrionaceae bacterium]|nr:hypothetical protein [Succinivibrionaceae bacterium]
MPFIEARITKRLSDGQKDELRSGLAAIIGEELGKAEGYIMVGIADGYALYLGKERLGEGAMISVQHMGNKDPDAYRAITRRMTETLGQLLGTQGDQVYITFQCINEWGWRGELL